MFIKSLLLKYRRWAQVVWYYVDVRVLGWDLCKSGNVNIVFFFYFMCYLFNQQTDLATML